MNQPEIVHSAPKEKTMDQAISMEAVEKLVAEAVERRLAGAVTAPRRRRWGIRAGIIGVLMLGLLGTGAAVAGLLGNDGTKVPMQIPYRGTLELNGEPVKSGTLPMVFELFDSESATTSIWSETQASVPVQDGQFNVALGANAANRMPAEKFQSSNLFLQVTVNGQKLAGRQRLLSVPYSLGALNAARSSGADWADRAGRSDSAANADNAGNATNVSGPGNVNTNSVTTSGLTVNGNTWIGGTGTVGSMNVNGNLRVNGAISLGGGYCVLGYPNCPPGYTPVPHNLSGYPMCCN